MKAAGWLAGRRAGRAAAASRALARDESDGASLGANFHEDEFADGDSRAALLARFTLSRSSRVTLGFVAGEPIGAPREGNSSLSGARRRFWVRR